MTNPSVILYALPPRFEAKEVQALAAHYGLTEISYNFELRPYLPIGGQYGVLYLCKTQEPLATRGANWKTYLAALAELDNPNLALRLYTGDQDDEAVQAGALETLRELWAKEIASRELKTDQELAEAWAAGGNKDHD